MCPYKTQIICKCCVVDPQSGEVCTCRLTEQLLLNSALMCKCVLMYVNDINDIHKYLGKVLCLVSRQTLIYSVICQLCVC